MVQQEPGKSSKNMQRMSLMLVKSFNIVMAWLVLHILFPQGFSSITLPFTQPPTPPLFIVHMFQSFKVKMCANY